jgi:hypothetical protein
MSGARFPGIQRENEVICVKNNKNSTPLFFLSRRRELNPRPADYESAAMPLSHGGAIPHNIDACSNKICVSGVPAQRSNLLGTLRLFWGGNGAEL